MPAGRAPFVGGRATAPCAEKNGAQKVRHLPNTDRPEEKKRSEGISTFEKSPARRAFEPRKRLKKKTRCFSFYKMLIK